MVVRGRCGNRHGEVLSARARKREQTEPEPESRGKVVAAGKRNLADVSTQRRPQARVTLLSLDPASIITGYAVMTGEGSSNLVEAGRLKAPTKGSEPLVRIRAIAQDLRELIVEMSPTHAVVEITRGKVNRNRHHGGGAGLGIYGMAVGYLLRVVESGVASVSAVEENEWTGKVPKDDRTERLSLEYPDWAAAMLADEGGDVADAIGLGLWWFRQRTVEAMSV